MKRTLGLLCFLVLFGCEIGNEGPDQKNLSSVMVEDYLGTRDYYKFKYNKENRLTRFSWYSVNWLNNGIDWVLIEDKVEYKYSSGKLIETVYFDHQDPDKANKKEVYQYLDGRLMAVRGYDGSGSLIYTIDISYRNDRIYKTTTTKGDAISYILFEFDQDNVKKLRLFPNSRMDTIRINYTYDGSKNPFALLGLFHSEIYWYGPHPPCFISANNVINQDREYEYNEEGYPVLLRDGNTKYHYLYE
ncbi:MAG: hypothetical protein V2B15_17835 [Bacteroidota bacterium]